MIIILIILLAVNVSHCQTYHVPNSFILYESYRKEVQEISPLEPNRHDSKCDRDIDYPLIKEIRALLVYQMDSIEQIVIRKNSLSDSICYILVIEDWTKNKAEKKWIENKEYRFHRAYPFCRCQKLDNTLFDKPSVYVMRTRGI